jgi:hypothetical protein
MGVIAIYPITSITELTQLREARNDIEGASDLVAFQKWKRREVQWQFVQGQHIVHRAMFRGFPQPSSTEFFAPTISGLLLHHQGYGRK